MKTIQIRKKIKNTHFLPNYYNISIKFGLNKLTKMEIYHVIIIKNIMFYDSIHAFQKRSDIIVTCVGIIKYRVMYPKRYIYIIKATNANVNNNEKKKKLSLEKTNKFSLIPCWSFMSDSVNDPNRGLLRRRRRTITYTIIIKTIS